MKQVSCLQALKFAFSAFIKKPFLFLGTYLIALGIMIISVVITLAISYQCFKPFLNTVSSFWGIWSIPSGGILAYIKSNVWISFGVIVGIVILYLVNKMVYDYLILGLTKISIDFYDKGQSSIKHLFSTLPEYVRYFVASSAYGFIIWFGVLISGVISFIGTRFITVPEGYTIFYYKIGMMGIIFSICFLPFLYLLIKYWFFAYFIVDQNIGPIESLKKSYDLKHGFASVICLMLIVFMVGVVIGVIFYYTLPLHSSLLLKFMLNICMVFVSLIAGVFLYKKLI